MTIAQAIQARSRLSGGKPLSHKGTRQTGGHGGDDLKKTTFGYRRIFKKHNKSYDLQRRHTRITKKKTLHYNFLNPALFRF